MNTAVLPGFRVLVVGFYGAPNVGDEVLLDIAVRQLRALGGEPIVASIDPQLTRRMHNVDAVSFMDIGAITRVLMQCDALLMGGGGIFQDHHPFNLDAVYLPYANDISGYARPLLIAMQLGIPTFIWGHGVGPLRSQGARTLVRELFQRATAVSVRDEQSRELLADIGVEREVSVGPDPGWQFRRFHPLPMISAVPGKTIAVVVREWSRGNWKEALIQALRQVLPAGWRIRWIAFQVHTERSGALSDLPLIDELREMLGDRPDDEFFAPSTPQEGWQLLAQADAVFSMRLHASVLALLAGRPTAGLEYDEKLARAHVMAGMPEHLRLSVDDDAGRFARAITSLVNDEWRPDPEVIARLEKASEVHLMLLAQCAVLPPRILQFDSSSVDWLALWLQQSLSNLHQQEERGNRAHELLHYRDSQLAEKESAMSALRREMDSAQNEIAASHQRTMELRSGLDDLDRELAQMRKEVSDLGDHAQEKEVYIALLRRQVEELEADLAQSRRETVEARDLWRRLRIFASVARRDAIRVAAAPFKIASIWRRHGLRVALQQIPRRMRTFGVTPAPAAASALLPLTQPSRAVRRERLLVLATQLVDGTGWPSRALQLAKGADRAGFHVRVHAVEAGTLEDGTLGATLCVDDAAWLQEVRAEGATRVLLADASARSLELAASARDRGARIIIDLASLPAGLVDSPQWPAIAAIADRVIDVAGGMKIPGLDTECVADAGDNEIFDSYRTHAMPDYYSGRYANVLVVELGEGDREWLLRAANVCPGVMFHVAGAGTDLADVHPRIQPLAWTWLPESMAPLLAHAQSVVVIGGDDGANPLLRRLVIAALLLEKPVFVDVEPAALTSPNLHVVTIAQLPDALNNAVGEEDYSFVSTHAWLGRAEQLMQPWYPESVSVVVLIHNNRRIIERCLSTLLAHAGEWLKEIVVVDNQSSDGGPELVESLYGAHPKVVLVRNAENGCSSGRNLGVKHSTGKYIAFFDSDQWLTSPSCFPEAISVLDHNDGIGTIGWNAGWFDATRDDLGGPISDYLPNRGMNVEARIKGYRDDVGFLGTSCMFIRRELFDRLSGFDTFYDPTCFEDTDICFQVKNAGYAVAFRDLAGVRHQPHQTTGASEGSERYRQLFNRNAAYFREKWKSHPEFFVDLKSWH